MERIRESAVGHNGARLLLRIRLFYRHQRRRQHLRNTRSNRRDTESKNLQIPNTRRQIQARVLLTRHGLCGPLHNRILSTPVRIAVSLRLRPLGHERHRRGRYLSLLYIAFRRNQRRSEWRLRHSQGF